MDEQPRPRPVPDATSAGFWKSTAEHRLVAQRCDGCAHLSYPPVLMCNRCLMNPPAFHWHELSGRGHVRTWTVMRDAFLPGFTAELPYIVADVEMVEQPGLRIVARLRGVEPEDMELGMPVEVGFEPDGDALAIPVFTRVTP